MTPHATTTHHTTGRTPARTTARTPAGAPLIGATRRGGSGDRRPEVACQVLDEIADVRFLPSGTPLALRWRGGIWQVIGEPRTWPGPEAPHDAGQEPGTVPPDATSPVTNPASGAPIGLPVREDGTVAAGFWRFHAQTGPSSPVLEFDITTTPHHDSRREGPQDRWREGGLAGWRLRRVTGTTGY